MKVFERIFLYSLLAILMFYVFLVDDNVESQVAIPEQIRARSIVIVNDAGQKVVCLWANEEGGAYDGGHICVFNKYGNLAADMGSYEDDGLLGVYNKQGDLIGSLP